MLNWIQDLQQIILVQGLKNNISYPERQIQKTQLLFKPKDPYLLMYEDAFSTTVILA